VFEPNRPDFRQVPRPAFGRAAQHLEAPAPVSTKAARRYQRAAQAAAELLPEVPAVGESHHCLMTGFYDLMQVISATLARLPTCSHLRIATLCYSKRNTAEILSILDQRRGAGFAFTMLVSDFFADHNKDIYERFRDELAEHPGAKIAAARSHCKVVAFDTGAGDGLVFEGSANLRTNRNREQLTVVRDRVLHDFHAGWIDQLVRGST